MPIRSPKWPFHEEAIQYAPNEWAGVYALWRDETLIFLGHVPRDSESMQQQIRDHLSGAFGSCTQRATHYGWELSGDPKELVDIYMREYRDEFGRVPRCNHQLEVVDVPNLLLGKPK
jgi:hypothetical protein